MNRPTRPAPACAAFATATPGLAPRSRSTAVRLPAPAPSRAAAGVAVVQCVAARAAAVAGAAANRGVAAYALRGSAHPVKYSQIRDAGDAQHLLGDVQSSMCLHYQSLLRPGQDLQHVCDCVNALQPTWRLVMRESSESRVRVECVGG